MIETVTYGIYLGFGWTIGFLLALLAIVIGALICISLFYNFLKYKGILR